MTGLPTVVVQLDDGTGAFPYDVTSVVRMPDSLSWSRGRSDELSENQPGVIPVTFDNTDGAFTLGVANAQPNPSFESIGFVAGGGQVGTSAIFSFDAAVKLSGSRSLKLDTTGAVGNIGAHFDRASIGVADGLTFTGSVFIRRAAGAGSLTIRLRWLDASFAQISVTAGTVVTTAAPIGSWARISNVGVAPALTRFVQIEVFYTAYVAGTDVCNLDLARVEQAAAPTYGVFNDQAIRVQVNGNTRATGKVQNWPVSWPDGDDTFSVVASSAVDVLAAAARWDLDAASATEILADSPAGFWPLDETSTFTTQGRDLTGQQPPLVILPGTGTMQFGQDLGTPDGAKGVKVSGNATVQLVPSTPATYSGASLHLEVTYNLSTAFTTGSGAFIILAEITEGGVPNQVLLQLGENGDMAVKRGAGDVGYVVNIANYVGLHTVALDTDGASSNIRVDDVLIDTRAGYAHAYDVSGGFFVANRLFPAATGATVVVGKVAIGAKLSNARTSLHQQAILNDMSGETPAQRITRILGYTNIAAGSIDTNSSTILGPVNQSGRSVVDVLQETARSDFGDVFGDANGQISYVAGKTIAGRSSPAGTFDANWLDENTQVVGDMFGVVNYATGSKSSGGNLLGPVKAQASISLHGSYPADLRWNVSTDQQITDRLTWTIATYANPQPRVASLVLDLLSMDPTTLAAAFALDLTSFIRITGLPAQTPGGTTFDAIVQSITETVGAKDWTLTLNLAPKALSAAWILGDATYGVLDSTTKLYI